VTPSSVLSQWPFITARSSPDAAGWRRPTSNPGRQGFPVTLSQQGATPDHTSDEHGHRTPIRRDGGFARHAVGGSLGANGSKSSDRASDAQERRLQAPWIRGTSGECAPCWRGSCNVPISDTPRRRSRRSRVPSVACVRLSACKSAYPVRSGTDRRLGDGSKCSNTGLEAGGA
jgi:hypothetical protein